MANLEFQHIDILWGLLLIPLFGIWLFLRRKHFRAQMRYSQVGDDVSLKVNPFVWIYLLRAVVLGLMVIALAGPRSSDVNMMSKGGEGIEIVLAIDISTSMLARDLKPDRLQATKRVAAEFIRNRPQDKIGLVLYAGESFTQTPPTTNHTLLLSHLSEVTHNMVEDGTAIGMGLATAVNRLKKSENKSKVVILLSDGENNRGMIDPLTAADLAAQFGVRVYTIGVGTKGEAQTPYAIDHQGNLLYRNMPVNIDERLLQQIAERCDGKYFRATDNKSLETIYEQIDEMERTKLEEVSYLQIDEKHFPFLFWALMLLIFELFLRKTWLKSVME